VSTLSDEFALIDWLRRRSGAKRHGRVNLSIGDDTAAIAFPEPSEALLTVDVLLDGVHFSRAKATAREIGRKALAVNLSDIAAMAGRPLAAVVGVALDRTLGSSYAQELLEGLERLADQYDVALVGGDTNIWNGPFVVSVTLLGEATERGAVRRSGARPGDWIMVTGSLGGSLAGKHLHFEPRVREALRLHEQVDLHAMIDISDGLAADLHHILDESHVGATVDAEAIPISESARTATGGQSALEHALEDGEDFELLFTVDPQDGARLLQGNPLHVSVTRIGQITEEMARHLRHASGQHSPLIPTGWRHTF